MSTQLDRTPELTTADDFDRETRLRFMQIDRGTGALLQEFWPVVEAALSDILETFYRHMMAEPELARMIGNESGRLKEVQKSHWEKLFTGRFDTSYMEAVRTI